MDRLASRVCTICPLWSAPAIQGTKGDIEILLHTLHGEFMVYCMCASLSTSACATDSHVPSLNHRNRLTEVLHLPKSDATLLQQQKRSCLI